MEKGPDTTTDADASALERDGYLVIEDLLSVGELATLRAALENVLAVDLLGRNDFEGFLTQRCYTLVARGKPFEALAQHPRILGICDALFLPGYLLTASQAIEIRPGETPQAYHTDDAFYPIPRPRKAISVATIWAIDDFSAENGGTTIVPGSHRWDSDRIWRYVDRIDFATRPRTERAPSNEPVSSATAEALEVRPLPVEMPAGSVLVLLGTLLHRGGANRTNAPRTAISNQYCEPWARQQENFTYAVPPEVAAGMSDRLQELLGFSIYGPFMGHVGGRHPRRALKGRAHREAQRPRTAAGEG